MSHVSAQSTGVTATAGTESQAVPNDDSGGTKTTNEKISRAEEKCDEPDDYDVTSFTVFVFNIPLMATEEDLKKHFGTETTVSEVYLLQTRLEHFSGCAALKLPDKAAYEAALKLTGSVLFNKNLIVIPHRCMINPVKTEDKGRLMQIVVSNIPKSIAFLEAKRLFCSAGRMAHFYSDMPSKRIPRDQLFASNWTATITARAMDSYENFLKLDGLILAGLAVKFKPFVPDEKRASEQEEVSKKLKLAEEEKINNSLRVVVENLPPPADSYNILEHMQQAGEVVKCWIPDDRKSGNRIKLAHVVMADAEGKRKALELSGSVLMGTVLRINPYLKRRQADKRKLVTYGWIENPNIVVASNLPPKCTVEDIRWHFEPEVKIQAIRFPRDPTLNIAYLCLGNYSLLQKILKFNKTYMDKHCISVMESYNNRVPQNWVNLRTQNRKMKSIQKAKKFGTGSLPAALTPLQLARRERRLKKRLERRLKKGSIHLSNPDISSKRRRGRDGRSSFNRTSSANASGMHTMSSTSLESSKKKEIEELARAALAELEDRTLTSENYRAPNTAYGSNYSYTGNTSVMRNTSNNAYSDQMNAGRGTFGPEPHVGVYGQSSFHQTSSASDSGMHERSHRPLEASTRKEIEQIAQAAISELANRQSVSNIYSDRGNTSIMGNLYSPSNNTYSRNNNAFGSHSNVYGSNNSTGNYDRDISSYNRVSSYGAHSGSYNSSSSYYRRK